METNKYRSNKNKVTRSVKLNGYEKSIIGVRFTECQCCGSDFISNLKSEFILLNVLFLGNVYVHLILFLNINNVDTNTSLMYKIVTL